MSEKTVRVAEFEKASAALFVVKMYVSDLLPEGANRAFNARMAEELAPMREREAKAAGATRKSAMANKRVAELMTQRDAATGKSRERLSNTLRRARFRLKKLEKCAAELNAATELTNEQLFHGFLVAVGLREADHVRHQPHTAPEGFTFCMTPKGTQLTFMGEKVKIVLDTPHDHSAWTVELHGPKSTVERMCKRVHTTWTDSKPTADDHH